MAEGTSLLRMHTAYTCIVGSNPTVSARIKQKSLPCGRLFCLSGLNGGIRRTGPCRPSPLRIAQSPRYARPVGRAAANAVPSLQALAASAPSASGHLSTPIPTPVFLSYKYPK